MRKTDLTEEALCPAISEMENGPADLLKLSSAELDSQVDGEALQENCHEH
jgi:hypothetical protein